MTIVSCYLSRGREKAICQVLLFVPPVPVRAQHLAGNRGAAKYIFCCYVFMCLCICLFVYLRNCVFDVMFAALVPVMAEQLAGRRRKGGKVCWGKRRPAIISPCLAATGLINERRVKLSAPGSCCSGTT